MSSGDYGWWQRGLEVTGGERALTREEMQRLGLTHDVGCGFFLKRQRYARLVKDDTLAPAAIWASGGKLVGLTRNPSPLVEVSADDLWLTCAPYPIAEARWKQLTNGPFHHEA